MLPPDEPRISLPAAGRHPRFQVDGRPLSLSAVYRNILKGKKGRDGKIHKLATELGARGALVTTNPAIERFIEALNATADATPPDRTNRRPLGAAAKELAAAQLDACGI